MELVILADEHIRLETNHPDEGLNIDGEPFGPLQMLATSLALCTASTIQSYAETARLNIDGLALELHWHYVDDPYRVGGYEMTLHLPEHLPEARRRAIARAADTCTVHQTLHHSAMVATAIQTFSHISVAQDEQHVHDHHHHHHHDDAPAHPQDDTLSEEARGDEA